ncbi:MAG TPA: cadmium-translocating P-type ATPase [Firmicutes bacterium]|nr:cadmium-translocating P-type ATPase [Bacillota bacterium]
MEKVDLILKGLDCANCSNKIEFQVNQLTEVSEANLNFTTSTLSMRLNEGTNQEELIARVKHIVNKLEPHVVVELKTNQRIEKSISNCEDGCCSNQHVGHTHKEEKQPSRFNHVVSFVKQNVGLLIGIILMSVASFITQEQIQFIMYLIAYLFVGKDVLLIAIKNLTRGLVFDENFLMAIATIGAFLIGEYPEAIAVMVFYEIGELFQSYAVNHSRKSISSLLDIKATYANLISGNDIVQIAPELVKLNDVIVVKPGERVPLDGEVIEGASYVDTSALTGESVPRQISVGDEILAGCLNTNALLKVKVSKSYEDSTVSRILELVENASSKKAPTEKFMTKVARVYTPIVVALALCIAILPPLLYGELLTDWIYRACIFLVVSCPCAIVVSIPLGFFAGLGGASKKGVLIKGGNYLEGLNNVETVVFDKTGTLTKGVFKLTEIQSEDMSAEDFLKYAAYAESQSTHPIAKSIVNEYGLTIDVDNLKGYEELAGHGIKAMVFNAEVLVGNEKLMQSIGLSVPKPNVLGSIVYMSINGEYKGYLVISDELKENSKEAISTLKALGVKKVVMLTGDIQASADFVANELGIDEVYAELLPHQKVEYVEQLLERQQSGKLVFVGDGMNDAPVLARADIGVAMGGIGSDAAIEAADVVLMQDDPQSLVEGIKKAKQTNTLLWQNIIFALGIKILVMGLGAFGIASMWEAVFADVGVTIIAVLNSTRGLRK